MLIQGQSVFFSQLELRASEVFESRAGNEFEPADSPLFKVNLLEMKETTMNQTDEIIAYIKEKKSFCDYLELIEHFVEKIGYNENLIAQAGTDNRIFRYHEDSYIHRDSLKWNEKKQSDLEDTAFLKHYEEPLKKDNYFTLFRELIETEEFPNIGKELVWTPYFLADLLDLSDYFTILGPERNAYAPVPNKFGINDFEGLVFTLLKHEYEERSTVKELSRRLKEGGVIEDDITEEMLDESQRIIINEKGDVFIQFKKHKRAPQKKARGKKGAASRKK